MPGAFQVDGIHQGLFRPPGSPASSSGYLSQGRPTDLPTSKRKRPRDSANHRSTIGHDEANSTVLITPASGQHSSPFAKTYRLAGKLDTPVSGPEASGLLHESMYSDSDFRRALGSKRSREDADMADYKTPTPLFNLPSEPMPTSPSWGSVAVSTIGGVVGKVWEFCRAGAFRGFHAGGGRGYDMQPGDGMFPAEPQPWQQREDDDDSVQMRIPGHFPRGDTEDYYNEDVAAESRLDSGTSTPSTPAAKRRQTAPTDELGRNWVMVKNQNSSGTITPRRQSQRPTPRNRNEGPSMATRRRISTPNDRKMVSPASLVHSPGPYLGPSPFAADHEVGVRPTSSASFASPRSSSPSKTANRPILSANAASPVARSGHRRRRSTNLPTSGSPYGHARTHSNASTASSRGGGARLEDLGNSPRLDREAKQLAARRHREERDADVRISAFNKQLQDMIRQGKEALGTTVEVDGDGDGGADGGGAWEDYE